MGHKLPKLPKYYKKFEEGIKIENAINYLYRALDKKIKENQKQRFISTSDTDLYEWEIQLNINPTDSDIQNRREKLKSKLRGSGTITLEMMKRSCESFLGGEVEIIENFSLYKFKIKFIGKKGIPKNIENFKRMVEDIKPAHLRYEIEYTYTTWRDLKKAKRKWIDLRGKTWDYLKSVG